MPNARRISLKEFKSLAKGKTASELEPVVVPKQFIAQVEKADGDGASKIKFTLSGIDRDRHGDTVNPRGWLTDNYKRNPVVLWAHEDWNPPIAKSPEIWVAEQDNGEAFLKSIAQFMPPDLSEFADSIYRMYLEGYMNAVSVGFRPVEWKVAEDVEGFWMPVDFLQQELLEYSAVPVPAYPGALAEGRSKGAFDAKTMRRWAEHALDTEEHKRLAVDREAIESFFKELDTSSSVTVPAAPQVDPSTVVEPEASPDPGEILASARAAVEAQIKAASVELVRGLIALDVPSSDETKAELERAWVLLSKCLGKDVQGDPCDSDAEPSAPAPSNDPPTDPAPPDAGEVGADLDQFRSALGRIERAFHDKLIMPINGRLS